MPDPTQDQLDALLRAAAEARTRAHAPYSGFPVGAAVLTDAGDVVPGANVENASYPLSMCAERTAVHAAVAGGARRILAVAVSTASDGSTWPCGGCRQVLHEFGPDMLVVVPGAGGGSEQRRLRELYPDPFGPEDVA